MSILRREPTTERHGGFDLLRFRPGPVHPSLGDLVVPGSPRNSISIPNLVWTPDRHSPLQLRTPELKRFTSLSLTVAWITGARHCTRRGKQALLGLLTLREITSLVILDTSPPSSSGKENCEYQRGGILDRFGKMCIYFSLEFNNLLFSDELALAVFEASRGYFYKD